MDQIAEEVKLALKPHFGKGLINKEEYKDIMRKTVPKVCTIKYLSGKNYFSFNLLLVPTRIFKIIM